MRNDKLISDAAKSTPSNRAILAFLLAYLLVMSILAFQKYSLMNSNSGNNALITNAFWNTIHGKPFYTIYVGMSHLGVHATYLLFLLLPFYWLVPNTCTLIFMESVAITASGFGFFLILSETLPS